MKKTSSKKSQAPMTEALKEAAQQAGVPVLDIKASDIKPEDISGAPVPPAESSKPEAQSDEQKSKKGKGGKKGGKKSSAKASTRAKVEAPKEKVSVTADTKPEDIKPAKATAIVTETGHHSLAGRGAFIRAIVDAGQTDAKVVVALVKARFPQNASPVNVIKTLKAYIARKDKAAKEVVAMSASPESKGGKKNASKGKRSAKTSAPEATAPAAPAPAAEPAAVSA